ncbi:unnamed protein product [Oncorhynchus mykiss]|uniref:Uncharacterized protein n=2 Tax=Oncorhynchus TaxID=8016 RepID=A0A060YXC9_ONCMY|nr:unnamed protein product [Oncorhynchus mykiss]
MLTSSDKSLSLMPDHCAPVGLASGPKVCTTSRGMHGTRSSLSLPEPEAWRRTPMPSPGTTRQGGLAQGSRSCSLQVPRSGLETLALPPRAASFDVPYRVEKAGSDTGSGSVSPCSMQRRRGGIVDQKDVIRAHESHKMQSTPQARRKEWE